ncbi:hypothetical protein [Geodermatophilus sp. SYSU D00710]
MTRSAREDLALSWADDGEALTHFDVVRPGGHVCRRVRTDLDVDLLDRVDHVAA